MDWWVDFWNRGPVKLHAVFGVCVCVKSSTRKVLTFHQIFYGSMTLFLMIIKMIV